MKNNKKINFSGQGCTTFVNLLKYKHEIFSVIMQFSFKFLCYFDSTFHVELEYKKESSINQTYFHNLFV